MISVASFYDMFELRPKGATDVYVCTNISCSLCGADELHARMKEVMGGDPDFNVRAFECLGACDIAPMASVNGTYVGPLELDDVERLRDDVKAGRPVLEGKQLARRKAASKHWNRA
jgi:NADH:ubiquinone oxidoreductase subunit E